MWQSCIVGMSFLIGASASSQALVKTSFSATQPTNQVVIACSPASTSGYDWRNNQNGRRDLGQSFQASSNTVMDAFSLKVAGNIQSGASLAPFTVKVFESMDASSIGSVISEQSGNYLSSAINPINPGWVTFDVEDIDLQAGNYYAVVLSFDRSGEDRQNQVFAAGSASSYSGGGVWTSADGAVYSPGGLDLAFVVQSGGVGDEEPRVLDVDQRGGASYISISAAVKDLHPGDTLRLVPGSGPYREPLYISTSGTAEAPIIVEGNNELITGFDLLSGFHEENGVQVCTLPVAFPCVLTYQGERLRQDAASEQFTKYAHLSADKTQLELLPGTETNGWEISARYFVVRIQDGSNHVYRNLKASGAQNDGFNLHGIGTNLVFENIEGFQNLDEGFSAHDNIQCEIRRGAFYDNDNGIGNAASCVMQAADITVYDNLGYGLWFSKCTGQLARIRSWNNGIRQIFFGIESHAQLTNCVAVVPAWSERLWVSYKESHAAEVIPLVIDSSAVVEGDVGLE